jgi:hypothetical protein
MLKKGSLFFLSAPLEPGCFFRPYGISEISKIFTYHFPVKKAVR